MSAALHIMWSGALRAHDEGTVLTSPLSVVAASDGSVNPSSAQAKASGWGNWQGTSSSSGHRSASRRHPPARAAGMPSGGYHRSQAQAQPIPAAAQPRYSRQRSLSRHRPPAAQPRVAQEDRMPRNEEEANALWPGPLPGTGPAAAQPPAAQPPAAEPPSQQRTHAEASVLPYWRYEMDRARGLAVGEGREPPVAQRQIYIDPGYEDWFNRLCEGASAKSAAEPPSQRRSNAEVRGVEYRPPWAVPHTEVIGLTGMPSGGYHRAQALALIRPSL